MPKSITLYGIAASPGIALGRAKVIFPREFEIIEYEITDIENEIRRFRNALEKTEKQLEQLKKEFLKRTESKHAGIFDAQLLILRDEKLINSTIKIIREKKRNAEYAFKVALEEIILTFKDLESDYLRERIADVKDVALRMFRNLLGGAHEKEHEIPEGSIIIAHDLAPSDTFHFLKPKIAGIATDLGSKLSHTSILARALGIPAVVGLRNIVSNVQDGNEVIIDGNQGRVIINPDEATHRAYEKRRKELLEYEKGLRGFDQLPCVTMDGYEIELSSNIDFVEEVEEAIKHKSKGIGLMRTEFLFLRSTLPNEEEQFRAYSYVAEKVQPYSVIIRTLDLGGDKIFPMGDFRDANPFLGWRAIRFTLRHKDIMRTQLRAILRASKFGNVKIMLPMITHLNEILLTKEIIDELMNELKKKSIPFDENIELGIMIETPSAAICAQKLANYIDFFSIGSNDLTQYTLACDRANPRVSYLYNPLHPAILKLIKDTIDAAHSADKWAGVCGEMASDPLAIPILIGFGIDELSVPPLFLAEVKKVVRSLTRTECEEFAKTVLDFATGEEVSAYMLKEIEAKFPEIQQVLKMRGVV